ncbi:TraB/GumN family protein [Porphyrobacter algicida]|uniref:TraB/GumN family protein n=1 Tax=Qipengyuania algicida TaxID=1836209 RepID=A0A845AHW0_9SPHN|nr:TraB/GumN family protein [Qipengyuania algicida]MXP28405.1 TraB/GumN family protein [Qipengyuania algicida]
MIRFKSRFTAALAATTLLAGFQASPGFTQAAAAKAESAPATEEAPTLATPALWKLSDKDTTIYLFGTVHALPKGINWDHGAVAKAMESAGTLVTEVPMKAMDAPETQAMFLQHAKLPEGQTLRGLLDPEQLKTYEAAMTKLGLPVATFDKFEPWFASITLTMIPLLKQGYNPANGVDKTIDAKLPDAVKRESLETIQYQLGLFDQMPQDMQVKFLVSTAEQVDDVGKTIDAMVADWTKGNADGLAELMNKDLDDPAVADRLLYQRNRNWAKWIEQRMDKPGTVFIAVGAGHLAGDKSVQAYLGKDGLKVTRVQ